MDREKTETSTAFAILLSNVRFYTFLIDLLTDDAVIVLPFNNAEGVESALPPEEVTKVALRLKYQIEQVVPCELEESKITKANSPIITRKVVKAAKEAGGKDYGACVIYSLLVCKKWFKKQALAELWDADLHNARSTACEVLAKRLYITSVVSYHIKLTV